MNGGSNLNDIQQESSISKEIPSEDTMFELAELYKMFADHTRIRILCVLSARELCVGDIVQARSMSQSSISHQLRILKSSRLLKSRRVGKTVLYSLADDHVRTLIDCAIEHVEE